MSDENKKGMKLGNIFRVGTPECAIFCAVVAMVIAVLILLLGFWKTVLVIALVMIGLVIGGVSNKMEKIKKLINSVFPQKKSELIRREDFTAAMTEKVVAEDQPQQTETNGENN